MMKMTHRRRLRAAAAAAGLLGLLAGCMTPAVNDPARTGPFFTPANVNGDAALPPAVRRVVLMPLQASAAVPADSLAALDDVFAAALGRENRFEVVTLSREECVRRLGDESLATTATLPARFLERLQAEFGAQAVLFVDVTTFRAYRPLRLGVRAKLAETGSGRLIWTFDNVFAADEPAVANAARHFFLQSDRQDVPADLTRAVLQSPSRFGAYAAAATFATLPPVKLPPARPARR